MLIIHHLGKSQSERIVWLCEELGVDYQFDHHVRDAVANLSPPALKALHPLGAAPVITDGDLVLAESGAIVECIIHRHGGGRLAKVPRLAPEDRGACRVPARDGEGGSGDGAVADLRCGASCRTDPGRGDMKRCGPIAARELPQERFRIEGSSGPDIRDGAKVLISYTLLKYSCRRSRSCPKKPCSP